MSARHRAIGASVRRLASARGVRRSSLRRLSLRTQLMISFMLVALLGAGVGLLSISRINSLDAQVQLIRRNNLASLSALNQARAAQAKVFESLWVHSVARGSG